MKFLLATSFLASAPGYVSAGRLGAASGSGLPPPMAAVPQLALKTKVESQSLLNTSIFSGKGRNLAEVCQADGVAVFDVPNKDLGTWLADGTLGDYTGFLTLPMYNGGKNDQGTVPIAEGAVAYDCVTGKLCAAAYYRQCYLDFTCTNVDEKSPVPFLTGENDDNSWINFGTGQMKKDSATTFEYIKRPDDANFVMGWEGCWNLDPNRVGGFDLQIHFNRDFGGGETTSTGKDVGGGFKLGGCVTCESTPCVDPTNLPPPPQCQKYNCEGQSEPDPENMGSCDLELDPINPCKYGTCSYGKCESYTHDNGYACGDSGETCCAGECKANGCGPTCPTGPYESCDANMDTAPVLSPLPPDLSGGEVNSCVAPIAPDRTVTFCHTPETQTVSPVTESPSGGALCGDYTATWTTPQDCAGDSTTDTVVYTLTNDPPTITVPEDVTVECDYDLSQIVATASDTCDDEANLPVPITSEDTTIEENGACSKTIRRTFKATDSCGNEVTQSMLITVTDSTAPVVNAPSDKQLTCSGEGGLANTPIPAGTASATDNCGSTSVPVFSETSNEDIPDCKLTITRTWSSTDDCGNEGTDTQTITVEDVTAPTIDHTPADVDALECGDNTDPSVTGTATATDTCTVPDVTFSDDTSRTPANCEEQKVQVIDRTWTATDDCGLTDTKTQVIYVKDTTSPDLTAPSSKVVQCAATIDTSSATTGTATANDSCSGVVPEEQIGETDSSTGVGQCSNKVLETIDRTWTATDNCGNTATATQKIEVKDETAPVLSLPGNMDLQCSATVDSSSTTTGEATATEECPYSTYDVTENDVTDDSNLCSVAITRTWTATDSCGNSDSGDQIITIKDTTPPQLTIPGSKTYNCAKNLDTSPDAIQSSATAEDTCPTSTVAIPTHEDLVDSTNLCSVVTTRIWTTTDSCGNAVDGEQTITVKDTTAPVLSAPGNKKLECSADLDTTSANPIIGAATAVEECPTSELTIGEVDDVNDGNLCSVVTTRTWTATDSCGNEATEVQTITVEDTTPPEIEIPGNSMLDCSATVVTTSDVTGEATASDTCPSSTFELTQADVTDDSNKCSVVTTRTWTATDSCGNDDSGTQTITVKDTTAPAMTTPSNRQVECVAGQDLSSTALGKATAEDACPTSTVTVSEDDVPSVPETCGADKVVKDITRTWTATDSCENSGSADQLITVVDTQAPELSAGPGQEKTFMCSDPCAGAGAPPATAECAGDRPTANDACTGALPVEIEDSVIEIPQGVEYTRIFSSEDACGNAVSQTQTIRVLDDCSFPVFDAFSGLSINVVVDIVNVAGGIQVTVTVQDETLVGDLRGVFFQVTDADKVVNVAGDAVTSYIADNGGVKKLANDAIMSGGGPTMPTYNVGVQIGTAGKKWDDYSTATFVVEGVSTDDISDDAHFGIRLTSVGTGGEDREESSKVTGPVQCCRA